MFVSDAQTEYSIDGKTWSRAVATWVHPDWPALTGATRIWTVENVSKEEAVCGSQATFRRRFTLPPDGAGQGTLRVGADNAYEVFFNGKVVGRGKEWRNIGSYKFEVRPGENELIVKATNYPIGGADGRSNPAGVIFRLEISRP